MSDEEHNLETDCDENDWELNAASDKKLKNGVDVEQNGGFDEELDDVFDKELDEGVDDCGVKLSNSLTIDS